MPNGTRERTNGHEAAAVARMLAEPAPWPEPPGPAAFRGLAGRVVETASQYTEADRIALLANFLAAFGVAIGPGPHAMVGATRHTARDYFALVGRTSKARKGDSWQPVNALFAAALPDWRARVASGLSTGEGLIQAVRDPREQNQPVKEKGRTVGYEMVKVDDGVEDKRLLVIEAEFVRTLRVMSRQGNTLSPVLRDAWDTGNLRVMTRSAPLAATAAYIGLVAHSTIDELRAELPDLAAANGYANRHLWLAVRRTRDLPEPEIFEGPLFNQLAADIGATVDAAQRIDRMERDPTARALWLEVYHELAAERPGLLGAILARGEAHVLRLSLAYALLDSSPVVGVEHLVTALEFWAYAERSAAYIFGDALGDPLADTILRSLRGGGELTRTAISALFGRHESGARIDAALQLLLTRSLARCEPRATDGRSAEVWTAV